MSDENDLKKTLEDTKKEAKETASEFASSAKETFDNVSGENKKVLAGVLGILFGGLGIHKFVLGYTKKVLFS
jgi:hypothetical protein